MPRRRHVSASSALLNSSPLSETILFGTPYRHEYRYISRAMAGAFLFGIRRRVACFVKASMMMRMYCLPRRVLTGPSKSMCTRSFGARGVGIGTCLPGGDAPLSVAILHGPHSAMNFFTAVLIPGYQKSVARRSYDLSMPKCPANCTWLPCALLTSSCRMLNGA